MSKIIKNSQVSNRPKKIELVNLSELTEEISTRQFEAITHIVSEKKELDELRNESERILNETETMVMELLQKARDEARMIIAEAQEEADALKAQAMEEARDIRSRAEDEGYEDGVQRAVKEMEVRIQESKKISETMVEEARQKKLAVMQSCEQDIVKLSMTIARKVVATELNSNPEVVSQVVREALGYLDNKDNVRVQVNPADLDIVLKLKETGELDTDNGLVEVNADRRISNGGCLVETKNGSVDASMETRIAEAERALLDVSGNE